VGGKKSKKAILPDPADRRQKPPKKRKSKTINQPPKKEPNRGRPQTHQPCIKMPSAHLRSNIFLKQSEFLQLEKARKEGRPSQKGRGRTVTQKRRKMTKWFYSTQTTRTSASLSGTPSPWNTQTGSTEKISEEEGEKGTPDRQRGKSKRRGESKQTLPSPTLHKEQDRRKTTAARR